MNTFLKTKNFGAIALAMILSNAPNDARAALNVGDMLPDLAGFKLEGKLPASLKGKVVILDFWASWCVPCAESFPVMEELQNQFKDRGLVIMWGAFTDDPPIDEPRTHEKAELLQKRLCEWNPALLEYVKVYIAQAPVKLRALAGAQEITTPPAPMRAQQ